MSDLRLDYSKALSSLDVESIVALMADDVTELRGTPAQGLNVIESTAGQICDLTVFFRPLRALQLVAEVIGARMAERFGALEEDPGR